MRDAKIEKQYMLNLDFFSPEGKILAELAKMKKANTIQLLKKVKMSSSTFYSKLAILEVLGLIKKSNSVIEITDDGLAGVITNLGPYCREVVPFCGD